jgi:hypothetical protein
LATQKSSSSHTDKTTQLKQARIEKLEEVKELIISIEPRLKKATEYEKKQLKLLQSVSSGLYDEIDKLSKKAPAEKVTDLVLKQMNEVIKESKELVTEDAYVQRQQEFIPAGDNPQHRDAVVVMRQIIEGLKRFSSQLDTLIKQLSNHLKNVRGIETAIQLYLDGYESVTESELADHDTEVLSNWYRGSYDRREFDFGKLDKTDLIDEFKISHE